MSAPPVPLNYHEAYMAFLGATQTQNIRPNPYPYTDPYFNLMPPRDNTTIFSQPTQYFDGSQNSSFSSNLSNNNAPATAETTSHTFAPRKDPVSAQDLQDALNDIPLHSQERTSSKRSLKGKAGSKRTKIERYWDAVMQEALENEQNAVEQLDDTSLSLKIARKLKSKSFILLAKRVDKIIYPQQEPEADSE